MIRFGYGHRVMTEQGYGRIPGHRGLMYIG